MNIGKRDLKYGMVSLYEPSKEESGKKGYQTFISMEDDFPIDACNSIKRYNSIPLITWLLNDYTEYGSDCRECQPCETGLDDILSGLYDSYFIEFAKEAKDWNDTIYIQMLCEFNTDWYIWSGYKNGGAFGGPLMVKETWRYIVNIFNSLGADNIKWIWSPHVSGENVPEDEWNRLENYWPGESYVDYMGMDAFNREDKFLDTYKKLTAISDKPFIIMTGSRELEYERDGLNRAKGA